jgi:hypothetical protein
MKTKQQIQDDPQLRRQHAMEGVLRRLAATEHAQALVLRGGLTAQLWVAPARRPTQDVDFLALGPSASRGDASQPAAGAARLREVLSVQLDDGVTFQAESLLWEVIFPETVKPGARVLVGYQSLGQPEVLQIDIGYGDPLVPEAEWLDYPTLLPGPSARVQVAGPELGFAWKVHGLFEFGAGRWRAKDLHDLWLFVRHAHLDPGRLRSAIATAFSARGLSLSSADRLLSGEFGHSKGAERKWKALRKHRQDPTIPEGHREICEEVAAYLRPVFAQLGA